MFKSALSVSRPVMVGVLVPDTLVGEWVHSTTTHLHVSVICATWHHLLVLPHQSWHIGCILAGLVLLLVRLL